MLIAQATKQAGVAPYERTDECTCYRDGCGDRLLTTRVGTITLLVPRLRYVNFSTDLFERCQRSEQALVLTMMEMIVNGVSTRKIKLITQELCGKEFSKSTMLSLCQKLVLVVNAFTKRALEKNIRL